MPEQIRLFLFRVSYGTHPHYLFREVTTMYTNSSINWQIRNVDTITGWMELQPQETLVWQKKEIPELRTLP